jgi:hypothetical protein
MSTFRSKFLASLQQPRYKDVPTPWGVVRVFCLMGDAYDRLAGKRAKVNSRIKDHALLVVATCFDPETAKPLFTEQDLDDLCEGNAAEVRFLAEIASEVNTVEESDGPAGNETTAPQTGAS